MAQMIPDYIDQENSRLGGERMVFEWFSSRKIKGIVLHSLNQKNQRKKLIGEIDFLLITARGMLCIEVKGGSEVGRKDGRWYSKSRSHTGNFGNTIEGSMHNIQNPFIQASDCMYALIGHLKDAYIKENDKYPRESQFLVGYAVVFPECIFTGDGNDLVTEVMFDGNWRLDDFPTYISRVYDYWENEICTKHNHEPVKMADGDIKRMCKLLRGDFYVVPSINLTIQHIIHKMNKLTEEQYDVLEYTDLQDRVLITGGAGTGKTLLALEKARRLAAAGNKVAYLCFNRNIALMANEELLNDNIAYVGTYHKLLMSTMPNEKELYFRDVTDISKCFINRQPQTEKYDAIVIDEAQDLMDANVWEVLSNYIVNGIEKGKWTIFYDPNQNIFNDTEEFDFAVEYLKEIGAPQTMPLTKNCRNTEPIGKTTSAVTMVPPSKHMTINGPEVSWKIYNDNAEFIELLRKELISVIQGGTSHEDIVLLSDVKFENSPIKNIKSICGMDIVEPCDILHKKKNTISYFTLQSFKGLEANVICYIGIEGFESKKCRMQNYVAMSRAKILLYGFYPKEVKNEYATMFIKGLQMF